MTKLTTKIHVLLSICLLAGVVPVGAANSGIVGKVTESSGPVSSALVYAYEVASERLEKVRTDGHGKYLFSSLPPGMYKVVAFKPGFLPAVELLLRRQADAQQTVNLALRKEAVGETRQAEDYWTVRGRLPADVLRQIQEIQLRGDLDPVGFQLDGADFHRAQMRALSGYEQMGAGVGEAHVTGAEIGFRGEVGQVQVDLAGEFQQLAPSSRDSRSDVSGQVRTLALELEHERNRNQHLTLAAASGEMLGQTTGQNVDMQHYQVDWTGEAGHRGETRVSAGYTQESNYHLVGFIDPAEVLASSKTWNIEGSYARELTQRTYLEAGVQYRQHTPGDLVDPRLSTLSDETLGVYGTAGSQIQPRVLVEYGLYSSVRDGSLSLMPHGGIVVQMGDNWRGSTSVAKRIQSEEEGQLFRGSRTAFYGDRESCREVGEACYEVKFTHDDEDDDNSFSVGAIHREFAETLRMYFSPDFFDRLESVFVVEGDSLPEVQFSLVRRVTPRILARLESNIASGGGGIFYATDEVSYENQVRYLVTSLDTRFQKTSTGVFVAFHHLEQAFNSVEQESAAARIEMQRLQLMLTQDLNALADLASKWALRLNMEVSRGSTPYSLTPDDEMYKKLTGGISVSF